MSNHEVTTTQPLLGPDGVLQEPGWSRRPLQLYRRADIKKRPTRIKEWDYYSVLSPSGDFGVCFTLSDDGYIGLQSVTFLDFKHAFEHTETILNAFPMGKLHMPTVSSGGSIRYCDKKLGMQFNLNFEQREIKCHFKNFYNGKPLRAQIFLEDPPQDSMVIATPWLEDPHAFYYNQKINCMRARGKVEFDGKIYTFDPATDYGALDWGRGVWTYDNTWYWGSGSGTVDGHRFGFNIGYGFGDTSAASENILFYDGVGHKLDDVTFLISDNYTDPWKFTSSDGRFEMDFVPIIDRAALLDVKLICSDQHQVFGRMSGTAVLDDGTKVVLKDFLCFAEKVHNKY